MRPAGFALAIAFAMTNLTAYASDPKPSIAELRTAPQSLLNKLYLDAAPGTMPDGDSEGTAIFFANSSANLITQQIAALVWQGKVFDTKHEVLVNKVFGFKAIKAQIGYGNSLMDGRESIIIDYAKTSVLFSRVRDEIREVAPGIYLGRAYWRTYLFGGVFVLNFILDFNHDD